MSNPHSAGRGTNRRPYDSEKWSSNFDKIDFSKKLYEPKLEIQNGQTKRHSNVLGDMDHRVSRDHNLLE
jgi:hypothetical protein